MNMQTDQWAGFVLADNAARPARVDVRDGYISSITAVTEAEALRHGERWLVPGLVDMHAHIGLGVSGPVDRETALEQAIADLNSGVLLIRDAGSPSDTRWVDTADGLPRLIRAGTHIAQYKRYLRGYGRDVEPGELVAAVCEEAGRGDGWVKIVADWIDRSLGADARLTPLWSDSELADAVAAAHDMGARVTAHTFARDAIPGLLDAQIDCIEHGTGLDADTAAECARRAVPVVPTMIQIANFATIAAGSERFPVYRDEMMRMHARRDAHLAMLHDAGVTLLAGTDAGGTIEHGRILDELRLWRLAGIDQATIFASATVLPHSFLGVPTMDIGARADFLVLSTDPRRELESLSAPLEIVVAGAAVQRGRPDQ